jgi:hypothetical protein
MHYFISYIFFALICNSLCVEEVQFTVTKISTSIVACISLTGKYSFDIEGEFSGKTSLLDEIYINLALPVNTQAVCHPFEKTSFTPAKLSCSIDVCLYPLNITNIMLPLTPPNSEKYKIQKWEEVIGAEDGRTNIVERNVQCLPKESNTFIPKSLTSKGCSGTKNTFSINGEWKDQEDLPTLSFDFQIRIDNANKDIAKCNLKIENIKQIDCSFDGEGDIQFEEKYFLGFLNVYKMEKTESSIHVDKCLGSSFLFLNFFLLSLSVLLLF